MRADLSPTARALQALELLQARPGVTAAELAARLGVSERAARRYVAVLREADVPVESVRGPHGGYRLGRGVRLPPLVFSSAEALGLVMAVLDGRTAGPDAPARTAVDKILRALPEDVGRQAATIHRHASAAPDRSARRPGPDTTSALAAAVADRRRVRLGYRSASGRQWEEDVDPWAVVVRHGAWYLLCHSHRAGAVRTYRVDRVEQVALGDETFDAPQGLDAVALLEQHLGSGREFATRVVFSAPLEQVRPHVRPPMGRLQDLDDGARCVLLGTTSNPAMYAREWLAAIPVSFRVDGGPELREAVADLTAQLTAALDVTGHPDPPGAQDSRRRDSG